MLRWKTYFPEANCDIPEIILHLCYYGHVRFICILLFLFFLNCTAFRNFIPFCFLDQRLEFVIRRKLAKLDVGINMCSMIFALIGVEPWDNLNESVLICSIIHSNRKISG